MTVYRHEPSPMPLDYGPELPLEDDDRDRGLRDLLQSGGLVPLDVTDVLGTQTEPVEFNHYYPDCFFAILGITSRNARDEVMIERLIVGDYDVIRDTDAAAFNLGHLVPIDGGVVNATMPMRLIVRGVRPDGFLPSLALTFWGRTLSTTGVNHPSPYGFVSPISPTSVHVTDRRPKWRPALLMRALRLLKDNHVDLCDPELEWFFERYKDRL